MRIEAVVFDWNGTLYDDLALAHGSVVEIFKTHNLFPPTIDQYCQEITAKFMDFYYRHGFKENFSGGGLKGDADALNAIKKKYYIENGHSNAEVRIDAPAVVLGLIFLGIKVGIVSAEIEFSLLNKLRKSDLSDLFGSKFIKAGVYGDKAPILKEICQDMNVLPQGTIYVDDTLYVDDTFDGVDAARRAGLIPVGFGNKTGYNSESRLRAATQFIIYEFSDLPVLIHGLNKSGGQR